MIIQMIIAMLLSVLFPHSAESWRIETGVESAESGVIVPVHPTSIAEHNLNGYVQEEKSATIVGTQNKRLSVGQKFLHGLQVSENAMIVMRSTKP